jgi:hypothetical protein
LNRRGASDSSVTWDVPASGTDDTVRTADGPERGGDAHAVAFKGERLSTRRSLLADSSRRASGLDDASDDP